MNSMLKEFAKHVLDHDEDDEIVVKTIKAKPEWVKRFTDLEDIAHQEAILTSKRKNLRDALWGMIHEDLDVYDAHLRYNDETREIEVLEEKE